MRRAFAFSSSAAAAGKRSLAWLDLRATRISVIERLCLEEALLRHDPLERNWAIVGTHEPLEHRFLRRHDGNRAQIAHEKASFAPYIHDVEDGDLDDVERPNTSCIVVMGIGGKPEQLLNIEKVKADGVTVVKRFSGGGTVILDPASIWTTFIGRTRDFEGEVDPFPKSIMQWSADAIFGPTFERLNELRRAGKIKPDEFFSKSQKTLVPDTKSCGINLDVGDIITIPKQTDEIDVEKEIEAPAFALRENDYVLGEKKMGGNAQSIVKGAWLHHTSFLWTFDSANMSYLTLPSKRPDYRGDRSHDDFLAQLAAYYGKSNRPFYTAIQEACGDYFDSVDVVTLDEAIGIVDKDLGGMTKWYDKSRTRVLEDF